jgi:hypothetical protein
MKALLKRLYCATFHTVHNVVNSIIPHENHLKIKQKSTLQKVGGKKMSAMNTNLSNVMEKMAKQIWRF